MQPTASHEPARAEHPQLHSTALWHITGAASLLGSLQIQWELEPAPLGFGTTGLWHHWVMAPLGYGTSTHTLLPAGMVGMLKVLKLPPPSAIPNTFLSAFAAPEAQSSCLFL